VDRESNAKAAAKNPGAWIPLQGATPRRALDVLRNIMAFNDLNVEVKTFISVCN
jgi:hypothetical protein